MNILGKKYTKGTFPYTWSGLLYAVIFLSGIIGGVLAVIQGNWDSVILAVASTALFVVPFVIERQFKIYIPIFFSFLASAFLYATLILGSAENYYQKFWWWDVMLHSGSGVGLGLIGLIVILVFFREGKIAAKPVTLCLFAFCFALSIGLLWEVVEFSADEFFHTNMQQRQTGVEDTMKDEIMDALGAFIGSAIGYFYLRTTTNTPFDNVLNEAVRENRKQLLGATPSKNSDQGDGSPRHVL